MGYAGQAATRHGEVPRASAADWAGKKGYNVVQIFAIAAAYRDRREEVEAVCAGCPVAALRNLRALDQLIDKLECFRAEVDAKLKGLRAK